MATSVLGLMGLALTMTADRYTGLYNAKCQYHILTLLTKSAPVICLLLGVEDSYANLPLKKKEKACMLKRTVIHVLSAREATLNNPIANSQ